MELKREKYIQADETIRVGQFLKGMERHSHEFIELVYFISGPGLHEIDGIEYEVGAGDLFLINPHVSHCYRVMKKGEDLPVINCLFSVDLMLGLTDEDDNLIDSIYGLLISGITSDESHPFLYAHETHEFNFKNIFLEMDYECSHHPIGYRSMLYAQLCMVLIHMFRQQKEKPSTSFQTGLVFEVMRLINEHVEQKISVQELARQVFVSPAYLSRLFKKVTNQNLLQFIQEQKIKKVCEYLVNTNWSIDRIIEEVGYTDKKFFYRIFYNKMNQTPGSYRRKYAPWNSNESDENPGGQLNDEKKCAFFVLKIVCLLKTLFFKPEFF